MPEQSTVLAKACTNNSVSQAVSILSSSPALITEPVTWSDSDGQELSTPPIFIAIDYGHADLVKEMLQFFNDDVSIDTLKSGSGDYNALGWASWVSKTILVPRIVQTKPDMFTALVLSRLVTWK